MARTDKFLISDTIEPLTVSIPQAVALTGESRSRIYELIAGGELEAVKSGTRTLVKYASLKHRQNNLPKAEIKPQKRQQPAA